MAILAAWASGQLAGAATPLPEVAAKMSPLGASFEPNEANRSPLEDQYAAFRSELVDLGWVAS